MCDNINELYNRAFTCRGSKCFNVFNMPFFNPYLVTFQCVFSNLGLCSRSIIIFILSILCVRVSIFIGHMRDNVF